MNLIYLLQTMLAPLMFFVLAASVSAVEQSDVPDSTSHLIPYGNNTKKEDNIKDIALIPAYVMATAVLLVFIPYFLWRIIHNWGSWKIHTPSSRPQYIRTSFGWVDKETWKLKQAKQAKCNEAKRDQHKIYRSTKANYKWIFYDPTGELQQRFNRHQERSYLRFLPSWMRSYPHGSLQSGISAHQSKATNGVYQLPELQFNQNSYLSLPVSLGNVQFDGSPMSEEHLDPYPAPDFSNNKCQDAIMPSTPGKSCLLPQLPMIARPDVVQVWRVRAHRLPERTGHPRLESEEELRGEVESPEDVIRRDTEHRLATGHPQETTNQLGPAVAVAGGTDPLLLFGRPPARHPRVYSRRPLPDPPDLEAAIQAVIRSAFFGGLESEILYLESRIRELRTDQTLTPIRGTLDNMTRERLRANDVRRLEDSQVRYAIRLQQYIMNLERRIHELLTEPAESPARSTLDSLMRELRGARMTWDTLDPIDGLHPVIPTSRGQLENDETDRLATPIPNTVVAAEPDTRAVMDSTVIPDHLANENSHIRLGNVWNPSRVMVVQASAMTIDTSNDLFRAHTATRVNASTPAIITEQTHGQVNRAVIEETATGHNSSPNPTPEETIDGGDSHAEGPSTDEASIRTPSLQDELRLDTQNPIAAALLRSLTDHDASLEQADPTSHRYLESEERIRAEAVRQTAAFYTQIGSSDSTSHIRVREVQTRDGAAPINANSASSSAASAPNPRTTTAQGTATAAPPSPDVNDAVNEELYTDAY